VGETFLTHQRPKIPAIESPALASQSVSAGTSEFCRAELDAFVRQSRSGRPHAWALVVQLQRVCLESSPATSAGFERSIKLLQGDRDRLIGANPDDFASDGALRMALALRARALPIHSCDR